LCIAHECRCGNEARDESFTLLKEYSPTGYALMMSQIKVVAEARTALSVATARRYSDRARSINVVALDSAATEHICPWRFFFVPGSLKNCNINFRVGDGSTQTTATQQGSVVLESCGTNVTLNRVVLLPQCPYMLISEYQLDRKGCTVNKANGRAEVRTTSPDQLVFQGEYSELDNLCHVVCRVIQTEGEKFNASNFASIVDLNEGGTDAAIIKTQRLPDPGAITIPEAKLQCQTESQSGHLSSPECHSVPQGSRPITTKVDTKGIDAGVKIDSLLVLTAEQLLDEHYARNHQGFAGLRNHFGMPAVPVHLHPLCDTCKIANIKATKISRKKNSKSKIEHATCNAFEEIHWDGGTLSYATDLNEWYFGVMVDRGSRKGRLATYRLKSENFSAFRFLYMQWRNEKPHLRLKRAVVDNESDTAIFREFAAQEGFKLIVLSAYTGKAFLSERYIALYRNAAKAQLLFCGGNARDMGYALNNAEVVLNDSYSSSLPTGITRNQAWEIEDLENELLLAKCRAAKPTPRKYNVFGSLAVVKTFSKKKDDDNGEYAVFLGLNSSAPGKLVARIMETRRIVCSKNISVNSKILPQLTTKFPQFLQAKPAVLPEEMPPDADGGEFAVRAAMQSATDLQPWMPGFLTNLEKEAVATALRAVDPGYASRREVNDQPERRSERKYQPSAQALQNIPDNENATVMAIDANASIYPIRDPRSEEEAMSSPEREQWIAAKKAEMINVWSRNTYSLCKRSEAARKGLNVVPTRFMYKIKWLPNPEYVAEGARKSGEKIAQFIIQKFKARWIAQGNRMKQGRDYLRSFTQVISADANRIIVCIAAYCGTMLVSNDFTCFYLEGEMIEDVYIQQPAGFEVENREDEIGKLNAGLYGTPQGGYHAQTKLVNSITGRANFTRFVSEPMMFHKDDGTDHVNVGYHCDDSLGEVTSKEMFAQSVADLKAEGLESTVNWRPERHLGITIVYGPKHMITLHQESNVLQFIASLGLQDAKKSFTPMEPLSLKQEESMTEEDSKPDPRVNLYQSLVGQALWVLQCRLDGIATTQLHLCPAMSKPLVWHFKVLKRLGRYYLCNPKRGLNYHRRAPTSDMESYIYCDGSLNIRSISGVAAFIGTPDRETHVNKSAAVVAFTKVETFHVESSMESELLAIGRAAILAEWLAHFRQEMGYPQRGATTVFTDSEVAIKFLAETGAVPNRQTRHVRRRVLSVKQALARNIIKLEFVPGKYNCADALTKTLGRVLFERHCRNLMGEPANI
jgi:hypothetical protein